MTVGLLPVPGYDQFRVERINVVAAKALTHRLREILQHGTLYDFARRHADALVLQGRAPVYAIPLDGERVAVRHAMRGGLLGAVLHDRFIPPTRVMREFAASLRLRLSGVPTPEVLAIMTYPAGGVFRRADVVTRYVQGADLAAVFADQRNDAQRRPILDAVGRLLGALAGAGAQHPDLNLKNILVTSAPDGYTAFVLDVDRVHFHVPGDPLVARANLERLLRSMRQWRERTTRRRDALPDEDLSYLTLAVAAA